MLAVDHTTTCSLNHFSCALILWCSIFLIPITYIYPGRCLFQESIEQRGSGLFAPKTIRSQERSLELRSLKLNMKFYAFFNDLIINSKINIFLEVRSVCNVPVSWGNQGEVPVSGLSGEFGSTCVVDGPNT